jgi:hypothetical protein
MAHNPSRYAVSLYTLDANELAFRVLQEERIGETDYRTTLAACTGMGLARAAYAYAVVEYRPRPEVRILLQQGARVICDSAREPPAASCVESP